MKQNRKRKSAVAVPILLFLLCLLIPFASLILAGQSISGLYRETYYGELAPMMDRLKTAQGRKIVVIGNSGTAFGVDTAQMEETLRADGYDYTVCSFGLYGSLGTRLMLDLSEESIGDGDIVLFMPELNEQALSMYFSAKEAWYAVNGHEIMLLRLSPELQGKMLGSYASFVAESLRLKAADELPAASGVYASASFDARCDMKNATRAVNTMGGSTDSNNPVELDPSLYASDFVAYVNDYAARITGKGAKIYYCFCPMNTAAAEGDASALYNAVEAMFSFPVLGRVEDSLMASGWFFDSNFHLNSAGMTVFTYHLTDQVKTWLGDTKRTELLLPDMPGEKTATGLVDGDNTDEACFLYEKEEDGWRIIGVTEDGKVQRELTIPCVHEGKPVIAISGEAFSGCRKTVIITIQQNITSLPDSMFAGCSFLRSVVLRHTAPEQLSVGYHLLDGISGVSVQVQRAALSAFRNNYFWGAYAEVLTGYDE